MIIYVVYNKALTYFFLVQGVVLGAIYVAVLFVAMRLRKI